MLGVVTNIGDASRVLVLWRAGIPEFIDPIEPIGKTDWTEGLPSIPKGGVLGR